MYFVILNFPYHERPKDRKKKAFGLRFSSYARTSWTSFSTTQNKLDSDFTTPEKYEKINNFTDSAIVIHKIGLFFDFWGSK